MPLISSAARCFDEVARAGSIRGAAERLNTAPSAVNRHILNLEAEFGMPLFERLPRGMRLTAAGEVLVNDLRRWRHDHDRARAHLQHLRGLRRGHVKLGVMECLAVDMAPGVFERIHAQHPGIALDVMVGGRDQIAGGLIAGEIDVAVAFNMPQDRDDLQTVRSLEIPIGVVLPTGHPLARKTALPLSDCAEVPLVIPGHSLLIRQMIDEALAKSSIEPLARVSSNSIILIKSMVKRGGHISLLSQMDVYAELQAGELVFRPVAGRRMRSQILSVCMPKHRMSSPAAVLVAETFASAFDGFPGA
jgi:DNA-binding transcriptional LysR family regulator